jgi:hypothetical protein
MSRVHRLQADFVLPAGLASAGRVEPLPLVARLLFNGIGEGFIALHAKQH